MPERSKQARSTSAEPHLIPAVEVRKLSVHYRNTPAVSDINWCCYRHRITALVGPSGCGKSTILHCLNRLVDLIPECRVSGEILLAGKSILDRRLDVRHVRRRVGLVSQRPTAFPMSIHENLDLPLREHGLGAPRERREAIEEVLELVGLWGEVQDRMQAPACTLSGGQLQRLCIARALLLRPEILLLDEPCSSLDPVSTQRIEELILRLRSTTTVVIVTHNIAQARRVADDLAVMWWSDQAGVLLEAGPAEKLFSAPAHPTTAAYLGGQIG